MGIDRGEKNTHYYIHYLPIIILTHGALFLKLLMGLGLENTGDGGGIRLPSNVLFQLKLLHL